MISNSRINLLTISSLCFFCCFLYAPVNSFAQGDLMVYPKRLVFEGSKRSQELNLSNNGNDTARYVISVTQIRMTEDGNFQTITQPDSAQRFADKNFRYFPRNVVLAPKESQTVKIQLIKTSELTAGEYRSHIYLRAEKENKPLGTAENTKKASSIMVNIIPVFGISIPVIIKVGESTAQIAIDEMSFHMVKNTDPAIKFKINRSGNMSVYGDITVHHTALSGKTTQVALIKGVAIYTPTPSRLFQLPLDNTKGISYQSGKLHLTFSEQQPKASKLAESALSL
jgi:hypothetical protein